MTMTLDFNFILELYLAHTAIMVLSTILFAKGKTTNLTQVSLISLLLAAVFFPASWIYCASWSFKSKQRRIFS
ncbi:hypothetical protein QWY77_06790 [Thalassotalea ponticola]|uniref:hypothetical protein n=1 Tax=Thalassotalea ponticola TaxID=1523392 RepID=UPI0025B4BBED|nr:hypothetical protein [Thalassotalea ponticola]MDN3652469.1 hypothetical protein [Thalassotalea ponticola]